MQYFDYKGQRFGTGLKKPLQRGVSSMPDFSATYKVATKDELLAEAAKRDTRGKSIFGRNWIKNQRDKGSCNGFAGAAALTRATYRRGIKDIVNRMLSGAYLYSLINGGRDGGSMLDDGMAALMSHGCATEQTVPWNAIYPSQYDREKADAEAAANKAHECYAVRSELELFTAAALGFDLVVAVHADNGFMQLNSDGIAGGGYGPGNHAVGGDGYYVTSGGVLVLDGYNSWDVTYGDDGRMGLTWQQHFRHTNGNHVFYAVRSTVTAEENGPPVAA